MCLGFHHCKTCDDTSPCGANEKLPIGTPNPDCHEPDVGFCARHGIHEHEFLNGNCIICGESEAVLDDEPLDNETNPLVCERCGFIACTCPDIEHMTDEEVAALNEEQDRYIGKLKCTRCGNPTPWNTLDINKEALCHSCSIKG